MNTKSDLITHRGGCIICMDYGEYASDWNFLVTNLKEISEVLTAKLIALQENLFSSCTAYLFGFSFGARVVAQAGMDFGYQLLERVHCKFIVYGSLQLRIDHFRSFSMWCSMRSGRSKFPGIHKCRSEIGCHGITMHSYSSWSVRNNRTELSSRLADGRMWRLTTC